MFKTHKSKMAPDDLREAVGVFGWLRRMEGIQYDSRFSGISSLQHSEPTVALVAGRIGG